MMIPGIVLTVIGLLLVIAFISSAVGCTVRTDAAVSEVIVKKSTLRGSPIYEYIPVFTYTAGGKQYTVRADSSTRRKDRFTVGQRETVFINPRHPEAMRYGSNFGFLCVGIVLTAAGVLLIVLSLI